MFLPGQKTLMFAITLAMQIKICDQDNEWCRRDGQTNQQNTHL